MLGSLIGVIAGANGVAALTGSTYLQIAIATLSLIGLIVVAVLHYRELRAERSEDLEEVLPRAVKRVRELKRSDVGVAPEAPEALASLGRPTGDDYLVREADDRLDAELEAMRKEGESRLIVLSGPSKAGKTRTLFEAMQRQLADAEWIAPADAKALDKLMKPGGMPELKGSTAVLWLDDLELYVRVGPHGMHQGVLERLGAQDRHWIVLATAGGKGIPQAGDPSGFSVPMEDLLRHATEIRLSPRLNAAERERLREYAPDAAERIAQDGIGEYMITGRELVSKLESGCHRHGAAPCPQGQAVVYAAIDWQRAGIYDPIPRRVLREAYSNYLPEHADPSDAGFEEGVEWARKPLYSTVALLSGRDELQPYDHVVASIGESRGINEQAWLCFLEAATAEQSFNLGALAFARSGRDGETDWGKLSERANRKTLESDHPNLRGYASSNLGALLFQRGDGKGAKKAFEQAFELGLVDAQVNLGNLLQKEGETEKARAAFALADEHGSAHGAYSLGALMLNLGEDLAEAEVVLRRAESRGFDFAPVRLGQAFLERGELDRTEEALKRADEMGSADGALVLGQFLEEERGDSDGAMAAYRRADERESAEGAFMVGTCLSAANGNRDEIKAAFRRASDRGNADGAYSLGIAHFEDSELDQAEAAFRLADEMGDALGAYNHGAMLREKGRLKKAEAAFRRAGERGHLKGDDAVRMVRQERLSAKGD